MFQCYLILGENETTSKKTRALLKNLGANFTINSPDISIIEPIKKVIGIDQIRQIKKTIYQKPLSLPYKFTIIRESQSLNKEAQNALLKILEEPPPSAIIILEASDKSRFLPTVLSRLVIIWAAVNRKSDDKSMLGSDKTTLLTSLSSINKPTLWLDNQMIILSNELLFQIKNDDKTNVSKVKLALELCKESKAMIESNVNPNFVLINLVLNMS